ncbi:hypothetical protein [Streptomyces sp. NPDC002054]|uniref:hypothetical protein n=1 Tax=Streptomyces sp. NPDC002054 TaxID=3154663 RepID=UPI00331D1774
MDIRTLALQGREPDAAELCARVSDLCRDGPALLVCDATAVTRPTLATAHALARAALTARRLGVPFRVRAAPPLRGLLDLVGLRQPLAEPLRQSEQREPPGRVQEGVEPDDPAVR